jgi:hypothetical protein
MSPLPEPVWLPCFALCACGASIQIRHWVIGTKESPGAFVEDVPPLTPCLGQPHMCPLSEAGTAGLGVPQGEKGASTP